MALNPPISYQGFPLRVSDEYILLSREGVELELKVKNMKKVSLKGILYLTSARLVMVSKNYATDEIKSVDMPLSLMRKTDFKQPIFGSNYLYFTILPLYNLLPQEGVVKLWFTRGGCEKFLKIFDVSVNQVITQMKNGQHTHSPQFNQQIQQGLFANGAAYQDKNDPTHVYVSQPQATFNNTQQFYGKNYFQNQNPAPNTQVHPQQFGNNNNNQGMGNNNMNNIQIGNQNQNQAGFVNNQGFGNVNLDQQPQQNQQNVHTNYPTAPNGQGGQVNQGGQNQPGHQTMNNPQAMNQAYNNNVSYYFGVPIGPRLNQN